MDWKLADAKNKFSEVVRRALTEGPQRVLRRNEAVVIVSEAEYQRLTGQRPGFRDYLLGGGPSLEGVVAREIRNIGAPALGAFFENDYIQQIADATFIFEDIETGHQN